MKRTLAAVAMLAIACVAIAHPGAGLEVDAEGTVYLSDIFRRTIWTIDAEGNATSFVPGSWSHEFYLDDEGDLVYENEHDGAPAPQSLNVVTPEGERRQVFPPAHDRMDFGGTAFHVEDDGSVLFTNTVRGEGNAWFAVVRKRDAGDRTGASARTVAGATAGAMYTDGPADRATFRMLLDMRRDEEGNTWLLDRDRVRVMTPEGEVRTHGPALIESDPKDPPFRSGPPTTWNRLYGLALDDDGNAYVAYFAGRRVHRISPEGEVSTAHECESGWAPVGAAMSPGGRLFVSEVSDRGQKLRVVMVGPRGPEVLVTLPDDA